MPPLLSCLFSPTVRVNHLNRKLHHTHSRNICWRALTHSKGKAKVHLDILYIRLDFWKISPDKLDLSILTYESVYFSDKEYESLPNHSRFGAAFIMLPFCQINIMTYIYISFFSFSFIFAILYSLVHIWFHLCDTIMYPAILGTQKVAVRRWRSAGPASFEQKALLMFLHNDAWNNV